MLRALTGLASLVTSVGLLLTGGCLSTTAPIDVAEGLQAEYVATGLDNPVAIAIDPDGRVFVAEKDTGQIRLIVNGTLLEDPVADVPVNFAGDRGLLGLAIHPRFGDNGRLYAFYSRADVGTDTDDAVAILDHRVVFFEIVGNEASGGEVFVASIPADTNASRVGGHIGFGSDDKLYVALGDMTSADLARDADFLYGKLLRYDDDGSIPDDNPTADSPIYACGFRNPVALTFDPDLGAPAPFVIDDCGDICEVNRIRAGADYGWPEVVGLANTNNENAFVALLDNYVDPLTETNRAVVGGDFNPQTNYGPYEYLRLFYGNNNSARIMSLELSSERTAAVATYTFATGFPSPTQAVQFSPAGTLYVATSDAVLAIVR